MGIFGKLRKKVSHKTRYNKFVKSGKQRNIIMKKGAVFGGRGKVTQTSKGLFG